LKEELNFIEKHKEEAKKILENNTDINNKTDNIDNDKDNNIKKDINDNINNDNKENCE
jgi:hypothetical protein